MLTDTFVLWVKDIIGTNWDIRMYLDLDDLFHIRMTYLVFHPTFRVPSIREWIGYCKKKRNTVFSQNKLNFLIRDFRTNYLDCFPINFERKLTITVNQNLFIFFYFNVNILKIIRFLRQCAIFLDEIRYVGTRDTHQVNEGYS